ncbi:MAG: hypothetical protein Q9169_007401 [Polycauliona sp. 2 TL-2023]
MPSDANPNATANTPINLADIGPKRWLHITDISLHGQLANEQRIDLTRSDTNNVDQLLLNLPALADGYARIYDYVAGEMTPELKNHLQRLFLFPWEFAAGTESTRSSISSLRWQWAGPSVQKLEWNPLYVPYCNPLVKRQYDSLHADLRYAVITYRSITEDSLLVLYERPIRYKALGPRFAATSGDFLATQQQHPRLQIAFVKLLLLHIFELHLEEMSDVCQRTFPSTTHEMLYRGIADVPQTITRIRNCTEFSTHVQQLVALTELVMDNVELEFQDSSTPLAVAEYLLESKSATAQLARESQENTKRYQDAWTAYRDVLNVQDSNGVKRLTLLATIFLPLSLSSSILAMSTRFRDLHLLLFDFIGVFFFLGSFALVIYAIIAVGNRASEYMLRAEVLQTTTTVSPPGSSMDRHGRKSGFRAFGYWWSPEKAGLMTYLVTWATMTATLLEGMLEDDDNRSNLVLTAVLSLLTFLGMVGWVASKAYRGFRMNRARRVA